MPPRLRCLTPSGVASLRLGSSSASQSAIPLCLRLAQRRLITADEKPLPKADTSRPGPTQDPLPHVTEEAAETAEIMGETSPELEQGTFIGDILKRDPKSLEEAPQILKEEIKPFGSDPKGTRSYSTMARRQQEAMITFEDSGIETAGHKFGLPELPLSNLANVKHRYDPVVAQVTNLLMQDGKLSVAQRNMAMILSILRTSPPPSMNPNRPLLPGSPPTSHLPLNPVLYLTLAIDSVAPLLRMRSQRGAAGGGVALQIPVPLGLRQRRRQAVQWILDAATKRQTRGSGRGHFAQKVAEEIIAVVEGRSGVWDRRGGLHKLGVAARANLTFGRRR